MSLDELDDLFDIEDLSIDAPTSEQLFKMYGIFLNDFVNNKMTVFGKTLTVNQSKSTHRDFKNKAETFVHVITRESKYSQKRQYDRNRANRIHWIRPILENANDPRIKCFQRLNEDNENQHYFYYEDEAYIVILREVNPDLIVVTAFCVDPLEKYMYSSWYREYKGI
jgi:hypothetical protein